MDDRPFKLQPQPVASRGPQTIEEFIQRVNAEPGGFRALNEADIRKAIEERNNAPENDEQDDDVDMEETSDTDDAPEKDIATVRAELLQSTEGALRTSNWALDFISLLISKENPALASTTLNQHTRETVGVGTLGATVLGAPTALTQSRIPDNKMMVIGRRLLDLDNGVDTALAASKRLEKETTAEAKYWSEVHRVSQAGWRTAPLPHDQGTMSVSFGFPSAELGAQGVAPLRRAEDGTVQLEHGKFGGGSLRTQVSILENDRVVGRSSLPDPLPEGAPLEDQVKDSRDTIFAQELWHELNKEARTLSGRNVRLRESSITYAIDPTRTISIELVALGEIESLDSEEAHAQDYIAERLNIGLSLQLTNAHRLNEQRATEDTFPKKPPPAQYTLLAPVISYFEHEKTVKETMRFLIAYTSVLRSAGIDSFVEMHEDDFCLTPGHSTSEVTDTTLLDLPAAEFDLRITPQSRLEILLEPSFDHGTPFGIYLWPRPRPEDEEPEIKQEEEEELDELSKQEKFEQEQWERDHPAEAAQLKEQERLEKEERANAPPNPLAEFFPPYTEEVYQNSSAAFWYLHSAVPRALTAHYLPIVKDFVSASRIQQLNGETPSPKWQVHSTKKGIVDESDIYGVLFDFPLNPATGFPELHVKGVFLEDPNPNDNGEQKVKVEREWVWTTEGGPWNGDENNPNGIVDLDTVVKQIILRGPTQELPPLGGLGTGTTAPGTGTGVMGGGGPGF
ncbi:subunit 17 of mediator complex-domain-containing protein [Podospora australis]|uniref:Mediator of RNA polymerase II transcription subunit 17 n=1 Tax=Podospora australis TaxID=1536484 RepID=A0AAN7AP43_9PEZI|nr:subunit 17 of mediator complex-domain-containing protein [Podospora australis]